MQSAGCDLISKAGELWVAKRLVCFQKKSRSEFKNIFCFVAFGAFPWQVLVRESTWLGLFTKNKCGGVLISNSYVVTAGKFAVISDNHGEGKNIKTFHLIFYFSLHPRLFGKKSSTLSAWIFSFTRSCVWGV